MGGLLKIADRDPIKYRLKAYKDYLVRQVEKHGIEVKLNTVATSQIVEDLAPDVLIVASGSRHLIPDIKGINRSNVFTAVAAHQSDARLGNKVVIVGGNMVGCETALYLQHLGKEVTLVEMTDKMHADANFAIAPVIQERLDRGIICLTNARCTEISDRGVHVIRANGKTEIIPADSVVLAVGMLSNKDTAKSLQNSAVQVIQVGDCVKPGTIREASRTGYFAALDI